MRTILISMTLIACVSAFARNIEPLSPEEEKVVAKLEALQWQAALSANETAFVTDSLVSPKDTIAEAALCTAIVHDFRDLQEAFQHGVGPANGYSRLLANVIASGLESGQRPIDSLRLNYLLKNVPPDARNTIGLEAGHIVAVLAAKMLRKGAVFEIDANEFALSSFDQKILLYSKHPEADAKGKIIQILAKATVAGTDEHDLIRVLASYDNVDLNSMLTAFEDEKTGEYGKLLLIRAVEKQADSFTDAEWQKAKSVFGKYHARNKRVERAVRHVSDELEKAGMRD